MQENNNAHFVDLKFLGSGDITMNSETDNEKNNDKVSQSESGGSDDAGANSKFSQEAFDSMTSTSSAQSGEKPLEGSAQRSLPVQRGEMAMQQNGERSMLQSAKELEKQGLLSSLEITGERNPSPNERNKTAEQTQTGARSAQANEQTQTGERSAQANPSEERPGQTDTPPATTPETEQKPWSLEEFRKSQEEARDKQREQNINDVVDSVLKDGKLPDNFQDMLRDFQSRPYFGDSAGDPQGLQHMVDKINERLKAAGSDLRLDVKSLTHKAEHTSPLDAPGSPIGLGQMYSRWTENHVNLRDANGKSRGHASVTTDVVAAPGVRF